MKPVAAFAEQLADAYSSDRYRNGWSASIKALRAFGCTDKQIEAVIRSKWTRWAADHSNKPDWASSRDLMRFVQSFKNPMKEIESLTTEHFGEPR